MTERAEPIDYLIFVPDGEPTLDNDLDREIEMLKSLGIKIAFITNASLIWKVDVRDELKMADWVSKKLDAINEKKWHKINRAHRKIKIDEIYQGILKFSESFEGEQMTETMLIRGINDTVPEQKQIAIFRAGKISILLTGILVIKRW